MLRRFVLVGCLTITSWPLIAADSDRPSMVALDPGGTLPADLVDPEDRSRWDLSSLSLTDGEASSVDPLVDGAPSHPAKWVNVANGELVLPWGTLEVTLQRGLAGPERTLIHRFIDRRLGVVAEVRGPATVDGLARTSVSAASVLRAGVDSAASLKLYVNEVDFPTVGSPGATLNVGWDRGSGVSVASLLGNNQGVTLMSHVIALDYWDFSPTTSGINVAQVNVPLTAAESCN